MTGRGIVVVLWDPGESPPPGPLMDAAALATPEWDWVYIGPPTPVRVPTMVTDLGTLHDAADVVGGADVVVGASTLWTLRHVAASDVRFVAVALGPEPDAGADVPEITVEGWPTPEQWPGVLDDAAALDDDHLRRINGSPAAENVADEIRHLLADIRTRYLPAAFRTPRGGAGLPAG